MTRRESKRSPGSSKQLSVSVPFSLLPNAIEVLQPCICLFGKSRVSFENASLLFQMADASLELKTFIPHARPRNVESGPIEFPVCARRGHRLEPEVAELRTHTHTQAHDNHDADHQGRRRTRSRAKDDHFSIHPLSSNPSCNCKTVKGRNFRSRHHLRAAIKKR